MSQELIVISQFPVIEEQLKALRESWEAKAAEASAMVCTEDTVQALKGIRAEMRKEFEAADAQRKAVKAKYMEPWDKVEAVFKECVKDAFSRADFSLKSSISAFENELKAKCEADLRDYFTELLAVYGIDFLTFEQAMSLGNIRISLSDAKKTTPRQLHDALNMVCSKVSIAVQQIQTMDDSAAIMVEYQNCFDVGKAIATVQARRRAEAAAKEAAEARKIAYEQQAAAVEKVMVAAPAQAVEAPPAPAGAPERDKPDPVFPEFTFTVYGARKSQLLKIRDYLRMEGIRYE